MQRSANGLQIIRRRQDPVGPNEPLDLEEQRIKRGKINQPQRAQKNPARPQMPRPFLGDWLRPQQPIHHALKNPFVHGLRLYGESLRHSGKFDTQGKKSSKQLQPKQRKPSYLAAPASKNSAAAALYQLPLALPPIQS